MAGLEAYTAGKYDQALDYFTRAESLLHAPTHQLYLARSSAKLGRLVSAREYYLKLTQERLPPSASKPFRDAQAAGDKELNELEPRVPYVSVVVQGTNVKEVQVIRDDQTLPQALLGVPHPEDPGTHTFKAIANGMESAPATILLKEGAHETVLLTLNAVAAAEPTATTGKVTTGSSGFTDPAGDAPSSSGRGPGMRIAAFSGIGLGAVGIGIGTYFLVKAGNTQKESDTLYDGCTLNCESDEFKNAVQTIDNRAMSQRVTGAVSTIVGGAFLATGITLLIVDLNASSSHAEVGSGVKVQPILGLGYAGLSGRF